MKRLIIFIGILLCLCDISAQAPVKRNTVTTNSATSTNRSSQRQTRPVTNTAPAKKTTSQPKRSQPSGYVNGHMAVDLGLSVRWADCNVGANRPEQFGGYFPFGDPTGAKYTGDAHDYPTGKIGKTEYDIAYKNWGEHWRLPTSEEIKELVSKCNWQESYVNGVRGYIVTGMNGNSIFLPYAGDTNKKGEVSGYSGEHGSDYYVNWRGHYWADEANELYGEGLSICVSYHTWEYSTSYKDSGLSVRAVTE